MVATAASPTCTGTWFTRSSHDLRRASRRGRGSPTFGNVDRVQAGIDFNSPRRSCHDEGSGIVIRGRRRSARRRAGRRSGAQEGKGTVQGKLENREV